MEFNADFLRAALLAVVQGITEFVPISSSGHLVLARAFFGWVGNGGLAFDTMLHGGSLAALLLYFRRDCAAACQGWWLMLAGDRERARSPEAASQRRLLCLVAVATIPAVIAGVIFKPMIASESAVRNSLATGISMLASASFFLLAEKKSSPRGKAIGFLHALLIGCAQVVALMPGASRSGWTIGAGMLCGHSRESSVRFSFLMAIPVIAGAIIFQARDIARLPGFEMDPLLVAFGFILSFAVSMGAIHFCVSYFKKHSLKPFAVYLACLGLLAALIRF